MEELIKKFFECYEDELEYIIHKLEWDYQWYVSRLEERELELKQLEDLKEDWEYRQQNRWKSLEKNKEYCKGSIEEIKNKVDIQKNKLSLYEDLKKRITKI